MFGKGKETRKSKNTHGFKTQHHFLLLLKGYSQLRKSELIDLIESKGSRSLLDDPVPDINVTVLVPTIVPRRLQTAANKVKNIAKKKTTNSVIYWTE